MDIATADWGIVGIISVSGLISLVRGFVKDRPQNCWLILLPWHRLGS